MAEFGGRVPESESWGMKVALQWRNQLWQSLEEVCRKARIGV